MIVDDLKKSLYLASFQGKLSYQEDDDSNVEEELSKIINLKKIDTKEVKRRKISKDYNISYDIPNSWQWVKLGFICDVIRGLTFSSSSKIKNDDSVLVLRGGNIDSKTEELIYDDNIYVERSIPNEHQYLKNGDILIVASSGTKTSVGKSAYVSNIQNDVSFGGFMMVVRPYSEIANPKYISYHIKMYRNKIINDTNGYISNITNEILNNLMIPLPPLEEQQRIIDKLDQLFEPLDDIKTIESELLNIKKRFSSDMKSSILLEAYSGIWSDEIYEEWNELKLNKIADIYTGNSISDTVKKTKYTNLESGYNYIATKDVNFDHSVDYSNGIKIPYDEKGFKYANSGSILMCIEGGSAGKKIAIIGEKVCFGNKLCKFECDQQFIINKFLYYFLQSPLFLKNFNDNLTGIIGGVSIRKIKDLLIKFPSLEEQQRIVDKLEQLLPLCDDIDKLINL